MDPIAFAVASAITAAGPDEFAADVNPEWTIAGKPNGGYLLAMLGRAAVISGAHEHVVAASAHFLRAPDPGPVHIATQVLRSGRSVSTVRATLSQDGAACIAALVTTGVLGTTPAVFWDAAVPVVDIPPPEQCVLLPGRGPTGFPVKIMDQVEVRLDPAVTGFAREHPSGHGELRGWLTLPAGEAFDPVSLLYAVDAFPPATFEIQPTGWVPTMELTAYVRALPVPGPVRVLQRAQLVADERVDETCFVWDGAGTLVAQCTQLAAIRLSG